MKQLLVLTIFTLVASGSFGQNEKETPTLQVVGNSKISVSPDVGVLIVTVTAKHLNFSKTIEHLNQKTIDLTTQIVKIGFKATDIKTTNFQIRENQVYRREEYIDSGYVATQSINVDFDNKKEIITKILNTFSKSTTDFTLSFNFKLSEALRVKVQDELLKLAVKDATNKANLISESSKTKLLAIKDISYGHNYFGGMREVDNAEYMAMAAGGPSDAIVGFTPNDLLFTDSVSITWEIEQ